VDLELDKKLDSRAADHFTSQSREPETLFSFSDLTLLRGQTGCHVSFVGITGNLRKVGIIGRIRRTDSFVIHCMHMVWLNVSVRCEC